MTTKDFKGYDTAEARRYIDRAVSCDQVYGLNGCVGELLIVLKSLVMVINVHYPNDTFSALDHARRLLSQAERPDEVKAEGEVDADPAPL